MSHPKLAAGRRATRLRFRGGVFGALAPFALFLTGVAWLALSGAPDERGFWPIMLAALLLGLVLARDRRVYSDALLAGMSQPIVATMILAWILAGVLGTVLRAAGVIDALAAACISAELSGSAFAVGTFLVAALVSTATGTSFGTIVICAPLLYPLSGPLGAHPAMLIGGILGGATFGDNVSPVSDTTIASATTQRADLGAVVRTRLRIALPAAGLAICALLAFGGGTPTAPERATAAADGTALWLLIAPALSIALMLRRRHLVEGLGFGAIAAVVIALLTQRLQPSQLLAIDETQFVATGLIRDGIDKAVGVSVFTLLLMALVGALEATGIIRLLIRRVDRRVGSARSAELSIFGATSIAVLLTTHSAVAILAAGDFAKRIGSRFGLSAARRANLLDVTVCTYPFLLPYCIPTLITAAQTVDHAEAPRLDALTVGLHNVHSWALLLVLLVSIARPRRISDPGGVDEPKTIPR